MLVLLLLLLQGANGVIRSTGDGFWLFEDVLFTYTATVPNATRRGAPVLAIALPVVFGVLLLVSDGVLAWWCTRKRDRCDAAAYALAHLRGPRAQVRSSPALCQLCWAA